MKIICLLFAPLILTCASIGFAQSEAVTYSGDLQVGKTQSVIVYVGPETGDYAAFCFANNSAVGRAVLAACKNGGQCEFTGNVNFGINCKVPGLEADLSASGRITKIKSVKKLVVKRPAKTSSASNAAIAPDVVVKNLYKAHNADKGPFNQTKSRARVDKYFTKDFADLIWNEAVAANGESGAPGFDQLYHAQDAKITAFKIGKPMYGEGNLDVADVPVTFKNMGKAETILFRLERDTPKSWKISNISYPYPDGDSLRDILMTPSGNF